MKRALIKNTSPAMYHYVNGERVDGPHDKITGDVSGISGDVSRIQGNVSSITGNLDDCDLSEGDRNRGVSIEELVKDGGELP